MCVRRASLFKATQDLCWGRKGILQQRKYQLLHLFVELPLVQVSNFYSAKKRQTRKIGTTITCVALFFDDYIISFLKFQQICIHVLDMYYLHNKSCIFYLCVCKCVHMPVWCVVSIVQSGLVVILFHYLLSLFIDKFGLMSASICCALYLSCFMLLSTLIIYFFEFIILFLS